MIYGGGSSSSPASGILHCPCCLWLQWVVGLVVVVVVVVDHWRGERHNKYTVMVLWLGRAEESRPAHVTHLSV